MKNKTIFKIIISLFGAAVTGLLFVLLVNIGPLKHEGTKGSITPVDETIATVIQNEKISTEIIFDDYQNGRYIKRLSFNLLPYEHATPEILVTVGCASEGEDLSYYYFSDKNPLYAKREYIDIDKENVVYIDIECLNAHVNIFDIEIDNTFVFNIYAFIFGVTAALSLFVILFFRGSLIKKPEMVFLIAGLLSGICFLVSLPRTKVGYDEETHLQAVMDIASFPSNELHISDTIAWQMDITEFNNPDALPGGMQEMKEFDDALLEDSDYKLGRNNVDYYTLPNRIPAYLSMAFAAKIGKGLDVSWPVLLVMMRAGNLLMYLFLMYLAIKTAAYGKYILMLIGLFPQNLFMAATVSYDPFITGCMSLGIACMTCYGERGGIGKNKKDTFMVIFAMLFVLLSCLPKAVYAPMIFLFPAFMKNRTKKEKTGIWLSCIFVFILLICLFILPTVIAPSESGDVRGGAVSEVSQVGFILSDPIAYAKILLHQMAAWAGKCYFGADCISFMGHIVKGQGEFKGFYEAYLILIAVLVALTWNKNTAKSKHLMPVSSRLWILFMIFGSSVLVWTAMYVAFSEPGALEIAGVQGRYFIPLLWPLYTLFGGYAESPQVESENAICYYVVYISASVLISLTLWMCVVSRFCI